MKIFKILLVIVPLMLMGSLNTASAQKKVSGSAAHMAAYGISPSGKNKVKKKKKSSKKQPKTYQTKELRINKQRKAPSYRKRNNWAS